MIPSIISKRSKYITNLKIRKLNALLYPLSNVAQC